MPCKLSSQVRACLFICDSLLSPINKSKRRNYLGRSVSLTALKNNLLGHERKHQCSKPPVTLPITTILKEMPAVPLCQSSSRKAARLLSRLLTLFRMVSTTLVHQHLLCREQMSPKPTLSASSHHHTSLQNKVKTGYTEPGLGGPVLAALASKRFRKRIAREIPVLWAAAASSGEELQLSWTLLLNPFLS